MDFKQILTMAAVAAAVVWASNNVTAVRRIIGR
jgi:hypothetical protein